MRMVSVTGSMVCFFYKCTRVPRSRIDLCDSNFPMQKLSDFAEIVCEKMGCEKCGIILSEEQSLTKERPGARTFLRLPAPKYLIPTPSLNNSIAQVYVWSGT